jgi:hypothetical protein
VPRAALPYCSTFEELYCARHACNGTVFREAVFRRCLSRQARLVASVIWTWRRSFFDGDLKLIDELAHLRSVEQVRDELSDFRQEPKNRRFLRRTLRLRLSSGRVIAFATEYLPRRTPRAIARC